MRLNTDKTRSQCGELADQPISIKIHEIKQMHYKSISRNIVNHHGTISDGFAAIK